MLTFAPDVDATSDANVNIEAFNALGELVAPVQRSQTKVSDHLRVLREAGLVRTEKRGIWVWYSVVPETLDALQRVLGRR